MYHNGNNGHGHYRYYRNHRRHGGSYGHYSYYGNDYNHQKHENNAHTDENVTLQQKNQQFSPIGIQEDGTSVDAVNDININELTDKVLVFTVSWKELVHYITRINMIAFKNGFLAGRSGGEDNEKTINIEPVNYDE